MRALRRSGGIPSFGIAILRRHSYFLLTDQSIKKLDDAAHWTDGSLWTKFRSELNKNQAVGFVSQMAHHASCRWRFS
jgi:hypothetical protein